MDLRLLNQTNASRTNRTSNQYLAYDINVDIEIFKITVQALISLLGVVGNIAVSVVISRNKKKKSSTELLIRNLAFADIGVLVVVYPLNVIKDRRLNTRGWPFGEILCIYGYPTTDIFYGVSVWSIVAIAVERYRHLVRPMKNDRSQAIKTIRRFILILWLGSFFVFCFPLMFFMRYNEKGSWCYFKAPSDAFLEAVMIFFFVAWYFLPLLIILSSYFLISKKLDQSNSFLRSMHEGENRDRTGSQPRRISRQLTLMQERRLSQNRRVKKILTPVVIAFVILMMPVNLLRVLLPYYRTITAHPIYPVLFYLVFMCVLINSAINPIIYTFISPGFRAGLRSLVRNPTNKVTFSFGAGSALRAFGTRINNRFSQRRSYSFTTRDAKTMPGRSVETRL